MFMKHTVPVPSEKGSNETKRGRFFLGITDHLTLTCFVLEDVVAVVIVVCC